MRLAPFMPGARPTISSRASSLPNERTGAFFQSGCAPGGSCRKAAGLGAARAVERRLFERLARALKRLA